MSLATTRRVPFPSTTLFRSFPVNSINNNERAGINWGNGGGWADATANNFPDWVQITFNGSKIIDHVVVYTVQDQQSTPLKPSHTVTSYTGVLTDKTMQGGNG